MYYCLAFCSIFTNLWKGGERDRGRIYVGRVAREAFLRMQLLKSWNLEEQELAMGIACVVQKDLPVQRPWGRKKAHVWLEHCGGGDGWYKGPGLSVQSGSLLPPLGVASSSWANCGWLRGYDHSSREQKEGKLSYAPSYVVQDLSGGQANLEFKMYRFPVLTSPNW